jgi:hypothetical protein
VDTRGTAREQTNALLASIYRLSLDDLTRLSMPRADAIDRVAARESAFSAARDARRIDDVRTASTEARELVIRAFASHQFQPTWAGLQWGRSLGTASDRANLIAAVEDAALASVTADLIGDDDRALLAEPLDALVAMRSDFPEQSLARVLPSSRPVVPILVLVFGVMTFLGLGLGGSAQGVVPVVLVAALAGLAIRRWRANRT